MSRTELDCACGTEKLLRAAESKLPSPQLNKSHFYGNKPVLARPIYIIMSNVADTIVNAICLTFPLSIINSKHALTLVALKLVLKPTLKLVIVQEA